MKKTMTVQEAGRLGGAKVAKKYGREHMSAIGKKGGKVSPTQFVAGDARTREIARKGGKASGTNFANDKSHAQAAGRLGGLAKKRNADARKAEAKDEPTGFPFA